MSSGRSGPGVGRFATIASLFVTCRWCRPGTQLAFLSPRQTESGLAGRDRRIPDPSGRAVFTDAPPREEIVLRRARMTKAAALLLAGSLALAACASDEDKGSGGGSGGGGEGAGDLKIGLAYDAVGRGDKSFNDSAYEGVQKAIEEHGGDFSEVTPNEDGSDRAELLAQLAEQGYNPVIAVGFAYDEVLADVAKDFPDTTFAQVDGSVTLPDGSSKGDNVTGLLFSEEQAIFPYGVA